MNHTSPESEDKNWKTLTYFPALPFFSQIIGIDFFFI